MTKYNKKDNVKVPITEDDLAQLLQGSEKKFYDAVNADLNSPMGQVHGGQKPVAIALCQGAAMHYHDGVTGYTDFDVYLFYDVNKPEGMSDQHPASRPPRQWHYKNEKYPDGDIQVDVLVRRIEVHGDNPTEIIRNHLQNPNVRYLNEAAVVLLDPPEQLGKVIWYKGKPVD